MIQLIKIGAIYTSILIVFHCLFWHIFKWDKDLRKLLPINKAVMQVLNISLTFVFVIIAYISFMHGDELLFTELGNSMLYCISGLWFFRAIQQVIFFNNKSWVSHCFTVFFILGGVLYGIPAIQ